MLLVFYDFLLGMLPCRYMMDCSTHMQGVQCNLSPPFASPPSPSPYAHPPYHGHHFPCCLGACYLQASLSLLILIVSYIAQQRFQPFLTVKGLSEDLHLTAATLEAKLAEKKARSAPLAPLSSPGRGTGPSGGDKARRSNRVSRVAGKAAAASATLAAVSSPDAAPSAPASAGGGRGALAKVLRIMVFMVRERYRERYRER
jgi:hypothetical protein